MENKHIVMDFMVVSPKMWDTKCAFSVRATLWLKYAKSVFTFVCLLGLLMVCFSLRQSSWFSAKRQHPRHSMPSSNWRTETRKLLW